MKLKQMSKREIFTRNGKPFFTGGLAPEVYDIVQDYIYNFFYNWNCFTDVKSEFIRLFQLGLIRIEDKFFSMLATKLEKLDEELLTPFIDTYRLGDKKATSDNDGSSRGSTSSDSSTDSRANSISNSNGRALNSVTPQSNVAENTVAQVDIPIKWNYATDMQDTVGKATSDDTSNTNTNANTDAEDSYTNHTDSEAVYRQVERKYHGHNIDNLLKIKDYLYNDDNIYDYLVRNLYKYFTYEF